MSTTSSRTLYGTFGGVFTPTILTILGVIMYLRLGWVVGNAGLLGAWTILVIAMGITACTGLSLSSIATNTRLGAGGPYAIISQSLGLEVGGSVGVPLYLSQALAVTMYIFGFREGWNFIFPEHSPFLVDLVIFGVVFGIAFVSADLAFRIQYLVMAIIGVSLVLILANPAGWSWGSNVQWIGTFPGSPENDFEGTSFWGVFAVFFPAATGVMAGANMSGDLRDPRRSIPVGTLGAVGLSSLIYFVLILWAARAGSPEELTSNYNFVIEHSLWTPGVLAGLLGATFSSALASLVGAPRILMALGRDELLPKGEWVARVASNGEPRRAMLVTGVIVFCGLMLRDLNMVAPLITMFFLISYAVINVVVLVEKSLGLSSFRPTMQIPWIVPFLGALGCAFSMFIVNPTVSLLAVGVVVALFGFIMRRGVRKIQDVRSGIFAAFAEWAAARVIELDVENAKAWKPSLLVPVEDPSQLRGQVRFLSDICRPEGSVKLMGVATRTDVEELTAQTRSVGQFMRRQGLFTTWSILDSVDFRSGLVAGLQGLASAFFRPNILFLDLPSGQERQDEVRQMCLEARRLRVGLLLLALHEQAGMGRTAVLNLWIRYRPGDAPVEERVGADNLHLASLMAWRIARAWKAEMNIIGVVDDASLREEAGIYLSELQDLTRLPKAARRVVMVGDIETCMKEAPQSDLDILPLDSEPDMGFVRRTVALTRSSCLFTSDSGKENALV